MYGHIHMCVQLVPTTTVDREKTFGLSHMSSYWGQEFTLNHIYATELSLRRMSNMSPDNALLICAIMDILSIDIDHIIVQLIQEIVIEDINCLLLSFFDYLRMSKWWGGQKENGHLKALKSLFIYWRRNLWVMSWRRGGSIPLIRNMELASRVFLQFHIRWTTVDWNSSISSHILIDKCMVYTLTFKSLCLNRAHPLPWVGFHRLCPL